MIKEFTDIMHIITVGLCTGLATRAYLNWTLEYRLEDIGFYSIIPNKKATSIGLIALLLIIVTNTILAISKIIPSANELNMSIFVIITIVFFVANTRKRAVFYKKELNRLQSIKSEDFTVNAETLPEDAFAKNLKLRSIINQIDTLINRYPNSAEMIPGMMEPGLCMELIKERQRFILKRGDLISMLPTMGANQLKEKLLAEYKIAEKERNDATVH